MNRKQKFAANFDTTEFRSKKLIEKVPFVPRSPISTYTIALYLPRYMFY